MENPRVILRRTDVANNPKIAPLAPTPTLPGIATIDAAAAPMPVSRKIMSTPNVPSVSSTKRPKTHNWKRLEERCDKLP